MGTRRPRRVHMACGGLAGALSGWRLSLLKILGRHDAPSGITAAGRIYVAGLSSEQLAKPPPHGGMDGVGSLCNQQHG